MNLFNNRKEHIGAQIFRNLSSQFCGESCLSKAETLKQQLFLALFRYYKMQDF